MISVKVLSLWVDANLINDSTFSLDKVINKMYNINVCFDIILQRGGRMAEKKQDTAGNRERIESIIREAITDEIVGQYLTAQWGEKLGVYMDVGSTNASVAIGESIGKEIAEDERPAVVINCPGIGNIDDSYYTDGWTTYDDEKAKYITEEGEELDFDECVIRCCKEGDIEDDRETIIEGLLQSWQEDQEERKMFSPDEP